MDVWLIFLMGLIYAASPGPLNVETLRRGMHSGFLVALALQSGSFTGRALYGLLALFGAGVWLQGASLQAALGAFGVLVMCYLGIKAIADRRGFRVQEKAASGGPISAPGAFWTGATLSLANPLAVVFWLSAGSRMMDDPAPDGLFFLAAFLAGCLAASLLVAGLASLGQSWLNPKAALALSWTCGLALIGFGLKLGYSLLAAPRIW